MAAYTVGFCAAVSFTVHTVYAWFAYVGVESQKGIFYNTSHQLKQRWYSPLSFLTSSRTRVGNSALIVLKFQLNEVEMA